MEVKGIKDTARSYRVYLQSYIPLTIYF